VETITTPVLIVGAGPAGLVTAIELARHGVRPLVIERHPSTSIFPRATGVSTRSMEIFRSYGIDDAVRRGGWQVIPREARLARLDDPSPIEGPLGFPDEADCLAVSPTTAAISPQDHLEPVLVEHLRSLGGEVRFSTELAGFVQDGEGVTATVRDRASGEETLIRAAYLVGADGHGSTVRRGLGIAMHGPDDLGRFLSILFRADLSKVLGERRYGLYVVGEPGPGRPPTVVVPSGADDRYVLGIPLPPGMDDAAVAAAFPLDRCVAHIREVAGRPELDVELLATSTFAFAAQVATSFRSGRAFLVGDAAHRMTPRGGRGMNTAIADGHDLGWKLAFAVRGLAGDGLLDTFEAERMPIARRNVALSMIEGGGGTDDGLLEDLGPLDAEVGHRAPHVWLEPDRSTLDLPSGGFALLASGEGPAWRRAVGTTAGAFGLPLRVTADPTVAAAYRLHPGGAVLIRPDGVIAARTDGLPDDPTAWLARSLAGALHRPATSVVRRPLAAAASLAWRSLGVLALAWMPVVVPGEPRRRRLADRSAQRTPRMPVTSRVVAASPATVATTKAPRATHGSHGGSDRATVASPHRVSVASPITATAMPAPNSGAPSRVGATRNSVRSTPRAVTRA
jgi:putative polyketide hydroxylase